MAILKSKEISKMSQKEVAEKINELRLELVRANVTANRASSKTKEIKKTISRLLTYGKLNKSSEKLEGELKKK